MSLRRWKSGLAAAAALVLAGSLATPVHATNWGSTGTTGTSGTTNGVWLSPDSTWVVSMISVSYWYAVGIETAGFGEYDPTDLTFQLWSRSTCTSSDVCVWEADYGDNGLNGWNACAGTTTGSHPSMTCSVQYVKINNYYDPPETRIACHELGHTVGLRHTLDSGSCLKRTADGGTSSSLTTHDKAHINAQY